MTVLELPRGEVAIIGLARTGVATARYLGSKGVQVYVSDAADSPALRAVAKDLSTGKVAAQVGGHDLDRIRRSALVVVSPGVPPQAGPLQAARQAGIQVVSELDLAARALSATRLIVVTGTNGKSTTTALIAHLLREANLRAEAAGNIGRPLIELALGGQPPEWAAVEASSFQLHDSPNLDPAVGVVTNLAPDHLDRYASVDDYYADKQLLFRNGSAASVWVLNGDDPAVDTLAGRTPGARRYWSLGSQRDAWFDRAAGELMMDGALLIERSRIKLLGDHNVAKALAAALAVRAAGVSPETIARGVSSFRGLAHRLELIREIDGVLWINDSKATNVASVKVALSAMDRPFVLIAGGRHKGEPYTSLQPLLARCRAVIAYGEAAELIAADLPRVTRVVKPFAEAVAAAKGLAVRGDAVLMSPACSSYDQFTDYEHRGAELRRLVEAM